MERVQRDPITESSLVSMPETNTLAEWLEAGAGRLSFPAASQRSAWRGIARSPVTASWARRVVAEADEARYQPIPALPATLYLDVKRTGRRFAYEHYYLARRVRLASMVLAECLERDGRFLDPILDLAWAICEESNWMFPAHLPNLPDVTNPIIDLGEAMTGQQLAEADALLGDLLDAGLRRRIRHECERRLFSPFERRSDFAWMKCEMNWNAVCHDGVVTAALMLLHEPQRKAAILGKALEGLTHYLDGFGEDGGTNEGPGYWQFGFGHYLILAENLAEATEGRLDLLQGLGRCSPAKLRRIAELPLHVQLSPNRYACFADCAMDVRVLPWTLWRLGERLDCPALTDLGWRSCEFPGPLGLLCYSLRWLAWPPSTRPADRPAPPPACSWLPDTQWMVSRAAPSDPDGLVLAIKGGHNAEHHNHNDVSSFIVHYCRESLIADMGAPVYSRQFFDPQQRYSFWTTRSKGHSVPLIEGCEQPPGRQFAARVVVQDHTSAADTLELDLTAAYPPQAPLKRLTRRVHLDRAHLPGRIELTDTFELANPDSRFESPIITFAQVVSPQPGRLLLKGDRAQLLVEFNGADVSVSIDEIAPQELQLRSGEYAKRAARRVAFVHAACAPRGAVRLVMRPAFSRKRSSARRPGSSSTSTRRSQLAWLDAPRLIHPSAVAKVS